MKPSETKSSEQEFLKNYDPSIYDRPSVTVDTLLFRLKTIPPLSFKHKPERELQILLIKRKGHPFKDHWAIPGGFVNMNESLENAAYRELSEETNIENVYLEQLYTFGDVDRDPRTRVISTSYIALTSNAELNPKAGDDAKEAKWFTIKEGPEFFQCLSEDGNDMISYSKKGNEVRLLSELGLAFDHIKILMMGLERIRGKLEYTDILFTLLPETFTLNDAWKTYEAIVGKPVDRSNFRRDHEKKMIKTGKMEDTGRKVPFFRYDPCWKKERRS